MIKVQHKSHIGIEQLQNLRPLINFFTILFYFYVIQSTDSTLVTEAVKAVTGIFGRHVKNCVSFIDVLFIILLYLPSCCCYHDRIAVI